MIYNTTEVGGIRKVSSANRVGSYSVNQINFEEWFKSDQSAGPIKPKKQKNKKKVIYPQLVDYANYTDDVFWVKKFNIWASGKLPKHFSYNNNVLYYNRSQPSIACELSDTDDIAENTLLCIDFFKTYGGIFSKNDEQQQIEESETTETSTVSEMTESTSSQVDKVWSKCDKKAQELMLKSYVHELSVVMKLSTKEHNVLLQTLRLAVNAKQFNKNNICIELNKITEIKGLKYDANTRSFMIDYFINNQKQVKKKVVEVVDEDSDDNMMNKTCYSKDMITQYQQRFEKYFELYDKKYQKYVACYSG